MSSNFTRDQIAARILNGDCLVILGDKLLNIPRSWLEAHPGGSLAILHFVGRDASDEIEAYHADHTLSTIKKYVIGSVDVGEDGWEPFLPPIMSGWLRVPDKEGKQQWYNEAKAVRSADDTEISPSSQILLVKQDNVHATAPSLSTITPPPTGLSLKVQSQHSAAYKALHKRIVEAGLYDTPYLTGYGMEVLRFVLLGGLSAFAYCHGWLMTSALFLGFMWHQIVFTVHDLGHMGVTHNWAVDRLLSIFLADFVGGLSIGWWVDNHNVHHLVTNHPSHDPDIEHLPFFAISPVFFSSLWSSYYKRTMHFDRFAQYFIAVQHKIFYFVMALARFNLYANSYSFLFRKAFEIRTAKRARGGRWVYGLEFLGIIFFWCWFGAVLRGCGSWKTALAYLLVSHAATSPVHVQIVLSHFSMSTADLGPTESFVHRQLRTTTDVICPPSISFIHGGLHLQVTHHLFPRLPRHNLRKASLLVKEFAQEQGLVYAEFGFMEGNDEVMGTLKGVADQLKLIGMVADAEAQDAVDKKIAPVSLKEKRVM